MPRLPLPFIVAALASAAVVPVAVRPDQADPRAALDELLDSDRAFAATAARTNVVDGLAPLFAPGVAMPAGGLLYTGRDAALAQLRTVEDNLTGRLEWAPVGGGISADGRHGFTFGFMVLAKADSTRVPLKYLAYWVKDGAAWKAAAYKRARRADGSVPRDLRPPLLPPRAVPVNTDIRTIQRLARELGDVERAFSALAGRIGLGPAFHANAAPDAMNMGGPQSANFVYGPDDISAVVGGGETGPSKLTWGPDTVIVASSGDLGVTIGHINVPGDAGSPDRRVPFFTVWRRASPTAPWRFVAE